MPLKTSTRVVKNRAAWDAATLGLADALLQAGDEIRTDAYDHAPFDPEHEEHREAHHRSGKHGDPHLNATDHVAVWVGSRKVGGGGNKPRSLRLRSGQVTMAVGFGDPLSHLYELGTVRSPARPFLLPSFNRRIANASRYALPAIAKRLRAIP